MLDDIQRQQLLAQRATELETLAVEIFKKKDVKISEEVIKLGLGPMLLAALETNLTNTFSSQEKKDLQEIAVRLITNNLFTGIK